MTNKSLLKSQPPYIAPLQKKKKIVLSYSLDSAPPILEITSDPPTIDPLEGLTVLLMAAQGFVQGVAAQNQMLVGQKKPSGVPPGNKGG